jgi:hypothetical protein
VKCRYANRILAGDQRSPRAGAFPTVLVLLWNQGVLERHWADIQAICRLFSRALRELGNALVTMG